MQLFSIKDVERLSGIKAHTLRMWEARYGLVLPHRKESKHRYYTNEDLRRILRVSWLYHQGYKISHIASLSETDMAHLIDKEVRSGVFFVEQMNDMLLASRDFNEALFDATITATILQLGLERAVVHVVYPLLEKIGLLWMNEELLPAQEHFASTLIRNVIIRHINELPLVRTEHQQLILLFGPEEEYHEIPLLFTYYLLRKNEYPVIYLGSNVSEATVEEYCKQKQVAQLHYHQLTNFTRMDAEEYLEMWSYRFPNRQVVASGPLVQFIRHVPPNARLIKSMQELLHYCRQPFGGVLA
ncbi:MAG: MerR family transcriptional regulator [Chitinophagaceae bacterium]|nr:MerR family transcriptional regulator [Chitinophagaceae bacterium]